MTDIDSLDLQAQEIIRQAAQNALEKMDARNKVDTKNNYNHNVKKI